MPRLVASLAILVGADPRVIHHRRGHRPSTRMLPANRIPHGSASGRVAPHPQTSTSRSLKIEANARSREVTGLPKSSAARLPALDCRAAVVNLPPFCELSGDLCRCGLARFR